MSVTAAKTSFLVQDRPSFDKAIQFLSTCTEVGFDTETTWTDAYDDKHIIGLGFYSGGTGYYLPFRHEHDSSFFGDKNLPEEWLFDLAVLFDDPDKLWIAHNYGFDKNMVEHEGLKIAGKFFCTMVTAHLINENLFNYELDRIGAHYAGATKDDISKVQKAYGKWEAIPPVVMGKYCVQDTKLAYDLKHILEPQLIAEGVKQLWEDEDSKYCNVLSKVVDHGILLDRDQAFALELSALARMLEIQELLGFRPSKSGELAHSLHGAPEVGGLGLSPQNGLSKRKTKEFPHGLPNLDVVALSMLRLESISDQAKQVIDLSLEFRSLQKGASTYYRGLQNRTSFRTGLVHPILKQHGTVTGRLSGDMQQIPRDITKYPVKKLFKSLPGYELWEFDYSQIELRFAVIYSRCESMGRMLINGDDIHRNTAEMIGAWEQLPNRDEARQIGKVSNYLLGYLGGPVILQHTIFHDTKILTTIEQCTEWHRGFHETYPEFRTKAYEVIKSAETHGYIKLWNTRKCRYPWKSKCGAAWSHLIQGGCGQVMKHTMLRLDSNTDFIGQMVSQVHDSLWIYLPEQEVETQKKIIVDIMEWPSEDLNFPFPIDCKRIDN